jgi:hypothetical protein
MEPIEIVGERHPSYFPVALHVALLNDSTGCNSIPLSAPPPCPWLLSKKPTPVIVAVPASVHRRGRKMALPARRDEHVLRGCHLLTVRLARALRDAAGERELDHIALVTAAVGRRQWRAAACC